MSGKFLRKLEKLFGNQLPRYFQRRALVIRFAVKPFSTKLTLVIPSKYTVGTIFRDSVDWWSLRERM